MNQDLFRKAKNNRIAISVVLPALMAASTSVMASGVISFQVIGDPCVEAFDVEVWFTGGAATVGSYQLTLGGIRQLDAFLGSSDGDFGVAPNVSPIQTFMPEYHVSAENQDATFVEGVLCVLHFSDAYPGAVIFFLPHLNGTVRDKNDNIIGNDSFDVSGSVQCHSGPTPTPIIGGRVVPLVQGDPCAGPFSVSVVVEDNPHPIGRYSVRLGGIRPNAHFLGASPGDYGVTPEVHISEAIWPLYQMTAHNPGSSVSNGVLCVLHFDGAMPGAVALAAWDTSATLFTLEDHAIQTQMQFSTSLMACSAPPAVAGLVSPASGSVLSGDDIIVAARLLQGRVGDVQDVEFQIDRGTGWQLLIDAGGALNPDPQAPYHVRWDSAQEDPGVVLLRTVLRRKDATVSEGAAVQVTIDHEQPQVVSDKDQGGRQQLSAWVGQGNASIALTTAGDGSVVTVDVAPSVVWPPTWLTASAWTPEDAPGGLPVRLVSSAVMGLDVSLQSGQEQLLGGVPFSISYPDVDQDGYIDGTSIPVHKLVLGRVSSDGAFIPLEHQSIDTEANQITAVTTHFSTFLLAAPASANVSYWNLH